MSPAVNNTLYPIFPNSESTHTKAMSTDSATVFMFSGQGSQYFQMGRRLYEENPIFAGWMRRMDQLVGDMTGTPLLPTLYGENGRAVPFIDITSTHPAIFMVEYALARTLIEAGVVPDYTLGASLGSFAAASVSGCLSMEAALSLVIVQATILQARCEPGAMIAVLSDPAGYDHAPLMSLCEVASVNFANNFVLSMPARNLKQIEQLLRSQSIAYQTLPVAFAFHSSWVDLMKDEFLAATDARQMSCAHVPLICCTHAETIKTLPREFFWEALRAPIRFQQAVESLEVKGAFNYLDLGPSGTLATSLKYILPSSSRSTARMTMTLYGRDVENVAAICDSAAS